MVRSSSISLFFKWFIPQCPANSITSRTQMTNVYLSPVPLHFQMTTPAKMEQSIGMNERRTDSFRTRVVKRVIGLIMARPIAVLDSVRKDLGSGSSFYYCPLDSQHWWLTTTSVGVEWQEGVFFFPSSDIH